jgi:hypothetical protein
LGRLDVFSLRLCDAHTLDREAWAAEISAHGDWFATLGNRLPTSFALKRDLLALRFDGKLPLLRSRTPK